MSGQYRINIVIQDDNDADDVRTTLTNMLADHDFCVESLSVESTADCSDCRKRVQELWALAADEELPDDELPVEWEQRCRHHAASGAR